MKIMTHILIVEDEPELADMYKIVFTQQKYLVELAYNGSEALEKAKAIKPALILLDFMLPKLDGLKVLQQIKIDPQTQQIPVILLTNVNDAEIRTSAMEAGALEYLIKSNYTPMQIVEIVRSTLQNISY